MTSHEAAVKERNNGIVFGIFICIISWISLIYLYTFQDMKLSLAGMIFIFSLVFLKIAYDAYKTPILYVRQRMTLVEKYKRDEADMRKNHGISKYNIWK